MPRYAALSSLTAAVFAAGLIVAGPASASGGGSTPPPTDAPTMCPTVDSGTGTLQLRVEANGAGCVLVDVSGGAMTLDQVILANGWVDQVKRADDGRIEVQFTEAATRDRVDVRVEPGRTEVK